MLRKFFSLILSFVIMSFVFLLCNKVEASGFVLDLHTKTKIYSSNDEDYYDGCEDFNDYDESLPTITAK